MIHLHGHGFLNAGTGERKKCVNIYSLAFGVAYLAIATNNLHRGTRSGHQHIGWCKTPPFPIRMTSNDLYSDLSLNGALATWLPS